MLDDDPGWPFSLKLLLLVIPGASLVYRQRLRRRPVRVTDGLVLLRQMFMTFCIAIVSFGIVLAVLYRTGKAPATPATGVAVGLLAVAGLLALFGPRIEKPLDCSDDGHLVGSYRTRFFLRIAFAEVPAFFGFVGFFLTYAWWTYPVGLAIAAVGFARAAPTAGHLRQDQERLANAGCARSLVLALRGMPPAGGTARPL